MDKLFEAGVEAVSLSVADPDLLQALSHLRDHAADIGLRIVFDLPVPYSAANPVALETAEDAAPSGAGKAWLYVEPDGDVLPAQGLAEQILGNILMDEWEKIYR
jgi:MoaA/NifB/PqqE/SkfB family radical SAM enzyme